MFNYKEQNQKYRVYRRYEGGWWDEWILTESFHTEGEARARVKRNTENPRRPWFEHWKYVEVAEDRKIDNV